MIQHPTYLYYTICKVPPICPLKPWPFGLRGHGRRTWPSTSCGALGLLDATWHHSFKPRWKHHVDSNFLSCKGTILCFALRIDFSVFSSSFEDSKIRCESSPVPFNILQPLHRCISLPTSVALCPWPKLHGTSVAHARLCRSAWALNRMWRGESSPFAAFNRIFMCISQNISFIFITDYIIIVLIDYLLNILDTDLWRTPQPAIARPRA